MTLTVSDREGVFSSKVKSGSHMHSYYEITDSHVKTHIITAYKSCVILHGVGHLMGAAILRSHDSLYLGTLFVILYFLTKCINHV